MSRHRSARYAAVVGLFLASLPAFGAWSSTVTYEDLLGRLTNLDALAEPAVEGATLATLSSRDFPPGTSTLADLAGPGCIARLWFAEPAGTLRVYLDGAPAPVVSATLADLFGGATEPFSAPLVQRGSGEPSAGVSVALIPYAARCRIEIAPPPAAPWHITYVTFPAGTAVESLRLPLTEPERSALRRTCTALREAGWDPQPGPLQFREDQRELAPGETLRLRLRGPAEVRQLRLRVTGVERDIERSVTLSAYWDGERRPSVWAPVGPFFASCVGSTRFASLPLGADVGSGYCFLRMPFRQSAVFEIRSEAKTPVLATLRVGYVPRESASMETRYFHARWRRLDGGGAAPRELLDCEGAGRLAGVALLVDQAGVPGAGWGSGEFGLELDGRRIGLALGPADLFGSAGDGPAVGPLAGCAQAIGPYRAGYRWLLAEPVVFDRSLRVTVDVPPGAEGCELASMAYWYQGRPQRDTFVEYALQQRLPRRLSYKPGVLQAEDLPVRALGNGTVTVVDDGDLPFDLDAGRGVLLEGEVGERFALDLPVDATGCYDLGLPTYGLRLKPTYALYWNGEPLAGKICGREGTNTLELAIAEPAPGSARTQQLILDIVALHRRTIDGLGDWMIAGPWDNPGRNGLAIPYEPERELRFDAVYAGKEGRKAHWQPVHVAEDACQVDLLALYGDVSNAVAYACCGLVASSTVQTKLKLGSDDGIRAWVNGELVHEAAGDRGTTLDQDVVPVVLRPGLNTLLLKIEQGGGGWSFVARIDDPYNQLRTTLDVASE